MPATRDRFCITAVDTRSSNDDALGVLIPTRQRGFEYLDDPNLPSEVAQQSLRDIALANRYFGGTRAVLREMQIVLQELQRVGISSMTLLDVGTGFGDIPAAISRAARQRGIAVNPVGVELTPTFARVAHQRIRAAIAADARALPLADNSVDVVTCSLVLHHLEEADAIQMLRECDRVARRRVIVAELRRSWVAIALLWLVSWVLRFHAISRHDGVVSIRRGFLVAELRALVSKATRSMVDCSARFGWRVTAAWNPGTSSS
ncbi:MAG: methyltransferase domain-containing protein [Phycisphaerae bacterium]|nr:methyltransferase domain-containing protein [Gemmatimonadaceae bacterium]